MSYVILNLDTGTERPVVAADFADDARRAAWQEYIDIGVEPPAVVYEGGRGDGVGPQGEAGLEGPAQLNLGEGEVLFDPLQAFYDNGARAVYPWDIGDKLRINDLRSELNALRGFVAGLAKHAHFKDEVPKRVGEGGGGKPPRNPDDGVGNLPGDADKPDPVVVKLDTDWYGYQVNSEAFTWESTGGWGPTPSVKGGTGPYTYKWEYVSGVPNDVTKPQYIMLESMNRGTYQPKWTAVANNWTSPEPVLAYWRLKVIDSTNTAGYSSNVTVRFRRVWPPAVDGLKDGDTSPDVEGEQEGGTPERSPEGSGVSEVEEVPSAAQKSPAADDSGKVPDTGANE